MKELKLLDEIIHRIVYTKDYDEKIFKNPHLSEDTILNALMYRSKILPFVKGSVGRYVDTKEYVFRKNSDIPRGEDHILVFIDQEQLVMGDIYLHCNKLFLVTKENTKTYKNTYRVVSGSDVLSPNMHKIPEFVSKKLIQHVNKSFLIKNKNYA